MLGHCSRACPRASVCCCIAVLCSVDVHCGSRFCAVCSWLVQRIMGGEGLELRTDNCRGWVEIWPRWVSCCIVATLLSTLFYALSYAPLSSVQRATQAVMCIVSEDWWVHFAAFTSDFSPLLSLSLQLCSCLWWSSQVPQTTCFSSQAGTMSSGGDDVGSHRQKREMARMSLRAGFFGAPTHCDLSPQLMCTNHPPRTSHSWFGNMLTPHICWPIETSPVLLTHLTF